jgi:hypothetical protein
MFGDFISKAVGGSLGKTVSAIGDTVKKFVTTEKDRMQLQLELETILQKRDSEVEQTIRAELNAKSEFIKAELEQGDNYTKRARPTILYSGVALVVVNSILGWVASFTGNDIPTLNAPTEFWYAWGGMCSAYVIGRSAEKRGVRNKVTNLFTGS